MRKVAWIDLPSPDIKLSVWTLLAGHGYAVRDIVACSPDHPAQAGDRVDNVYLPFSALHGFRIDLSFIRALKDVLRREQPDVVYVESNRRLISHVMLALLDFPDLPVVTRRGAMGGLNVGNPADWLNYFSRQNQVIACTSDAMSRRLSNHPIFGRYLPSSRLATCYMVPNFELAGSVDRLAARAFLGLHEHEFVVGTCCSIRPIKNIPTVAEAVSRLKADLNEIRLVVIGDHSDTREVARIRAAIPPDAIKLCGSVPIAARFYQAFDIFVSPTKPPGEGFGIAVAEAMAAKRAVVTSDVGGGPELIGETGCVAAASDPAAWERIIRELAGDPQRRAAMGAAAHARVSDLLSPEAIARRLAGIYDDVIERSRQGAT